MSKFITIFLLVLSVVFTAFAQPYKLSGNITDEYTGEVLIGANVFIKSLNLGSVSDMNGHYEITNIPKGTYEVTISFVGYLPQSVNYQFTADIVHNFSLVESPVLLQEAVVQSTRATLRETPVAFTEVKGEEIQTKLGARDLPQVLNVTPSLYSSAQGGGSGDANLVVRGFNQRNIAIMINGVPVNDMENGWVYWSNWAGLGSVTNNIQIQRGLGASPYSVSAIGGVVNIQTFGAAGRQEFSQLTQEVGSNGYTRTAFSFSSMLTDKIGMTALVARRTTDGYAEGLWLDEYTYFLSVGGVFGKHSLELTGVGSPQEHGQRTSQQTIDRWNSYGLTHNFNYGYLFDQPLNERVNKYHKPQWNLNWNWQINQKSILSTVAYFSWGNGYGSGTLTPSRSISFATTQSGYLDFDAAWLGNQTVDSTYSTTMKRSYRILRNSVNNHFWTGLLSTYNVNLTDKWKLTAGIDARYYLGEHYREVRDLLGGDYFLNTRDKNNPDQLARTGNIVDYHNDGKVILYGGFAQAEYKNDKFSVFLNASASNTGYQRIDYFNFLDSDPDQTTAWEYFLGYTLKGGVNLNIDNHNNVFVNAGYFSKAPIFDNVFDFANNTFENIENEEILGFEIGYGYATPTVAFNLNGFYTNWSNRSIAQTITLGGVYDIQANISGAEQSHIGGEFEGKWQPLRNLSFGGMLSVSENKFQNDVSARLYPEEDPSLDTTIVSYVDGLYVSDFPMTTASLYMNYEYELSSGSTLIFNPVYTLFSRYYAVFNPDNRTNKNDDTQSWRMPDYYIFNVYAAYKILLTNFFVKQFTFGFNVYNVMNTKNYITDATDGSTHDASTAQVWYGQERNYTASFTFNF